MRPQEYLAVGRSALDAAGVHVTRAIDGSGHSISVTKNSGGPPALVLFLMRHAIIYLFANLLGGTDEAEMGAPLWFSTQPTIS